MTQVRRTAPPSDRPNGKCACDRVLTARARSSGDATETVAASVSVATSQPPSAPGLAGRPVPEEVYVTPVTVWRAAFAQQGDFPENVTGSAFRTAWMRAQQGLVGKGFARIWGDVAWLVEAEA